ncbi:transcriptional regulator domain-containing protein [Paraburkholderia sp.]|uniref:transcriptional regulator domain-containing protein n=1 Tax=Paraburkholderia sp. TaxID=1926495 RepID=UPI003C7EB684
MKPNWRNADDYPRADDTSPREWAWEFLRRNLDYIDDWKAFKSSIGEYADRYPNLTKEEMARFLIDNRYRHVEETGSLSEGSYSKTETPLANWYGRKWGLVQIADPDTPYDYQTHRWIDAAGALTFPHEGFDFDDQRYMAVAIDLTLPLDDQLAQVRTHYEIHRTGRIRTGQIEPVDAKRKRFGLYPAYLQVLDGIAAGAERSELASVLLSHIANDPPEYLGSKNIDGYRIAARLLSSNGYRALPLIPEK